MAGVLFRLFALALCALCLPAGASAADRFALLIGNSRYEAATPLRNPENDIEIVAEALGRSGFATTKIANADAAAMSAAVDAFVSDVSASDNPVVMLYFAGHGVQLEGENYLLPVDAKLGSGDELKAGALSLGDLARRLDRVKSRLQMIVLDSCRDDPFEEKTRGLRRGLADAPETIGRLVAFSTSPGTVATDGDSGASPYASAFAEAVTIPGLALEDVFKRVRATVKERTAGKQEPWENSAIYGDFRFVEAQQTAPADADEIAFFEFASLADSQEAYQKYLGRYPEGLFASLARRKIEFMDKDFSFRRQNETFKHVTFENDTDNRCGRMQFDKTEDPLRNRVANGEVVLLDFLFWLPNQACRGANIYAAFRNGNTQAWEIQSVNLPDRAIFKASWEPGNSATLSAIAETFGDVQGHGVSDFMLRVNNYSFPDYKGISLRVPGEAARANMIEHGCEDNCVYFQALVRFLDRSIEDGEEYEFEFVSAADLGLTWKYQNTLRLAAEKRAVEVAALQQQYAAAETLPEIDEAKAAPFRKTRAVAGWEIVAIVGEDRRFRNCRAIRRHDDRLLSLFRLYPGGDLTFGFFDPQSGFRETPDAETRYTLDGVERRIAARTQSPGEVAYHIGRSTDDIEAVKAGSTIRVYEGAASLSGSRAALDELSRCLVAFGG